MRGKCVWERVMEKRMKGKRRIDEWSRLREAQEERDETIWEINGCEHREWSKKIWRQLMHRRY